MPDKYHITPILPADIPRIGTMKPEGWSSSPAEIIRHYMGRPWFHSFALRQKGLLTAIGCLIEHDHTGWLAQIIVHTDFRGRGMGTAMTSHLVETAREKNIESLSLFATAGGYPMYRRLGFRDVINCIFLTGPEEKKTSGSLAASITRASCTHYSSILALDRSATGEDRSALLYEFLETGFVLHEDDVLEGFLLPDAGEGIIIAKTEKAGIELLDLKHTIKNSVSIIPEANPVGINHLLERGFSKRLTIPRMVLGKDLALHPQYIYSRMAGYSS